MEHLLARRTSQTAAGFLCLICGSTRSSRLGLRRHLLDAHLDDGVRYRCPSCRRDYKNKNSFWSHISRNHRDMKGLDVNKCAV